VSAPGIEVAIVYSSQPWADELVGYAADHGGLLVRCRPLTETDARNEQYQVLVVDERSPLLSGALVDELHNHKRQVLGIYHAEEEEVLHGKERLVDCRVDNVLEANAEPSEYIDAIRSLAVIARLASSGHLEDESVTATVESTGGVITAVSGAGGCGATEVAIELAHAIRRRGEHVILVDAADSRPSIARRLNLPTYPNLRLAVDIRDRGMSDLGDALTADDDTGLEVLCGLATEGDWQTIRPWQVQGVIQMLADKAHHVVVDVGSKLEDLSWLGNPERFGVSRSVIRGADIIVGVLNGTRSGLLRFVDWLAEVDALVQRTPVDVVINDVRTRRGFVVSEIEHELRSACRPDLLASVNVVTHDKRLIEAEWSGSAVSDGPFSKGVGRVADQVIPRVTHQRIQPRPWGRVRLRARA
jgi:MinD-like ATPase involved in chromosome partitioning or flagellar assembly